MAVTTAAPPDEALGNTEEIAGTAVLGAAPTATRKPSPSPSPSRKPAATPSRKPVKVAGPPPPPPQPAPPPAEKECPYKEGTDASPATVKSALTTAASTRFWSRQGIYGSPYSAESEAITVPLNLMKAVAWQESGWQSAIIACDGGIGTMQIMPATADWMNTRFNMDPDLDPHTLEGNAKIGAALLEWEIKYFGDVYFDGDYTLDPADCADETSPCLLNAIIASYNYGYGAVDTDNGIVIPNPSYVRAVRALMTNCPCLSY